MNKTDSPDMRYLAEALDKIRNTETLYVAFSKATKLPFIVCDSETFDDQAYIFETKEDGTDFVNARLKEKYVADLAGIDQKTAVSFFMNLKLMGANAVVFKTKEKTYNLQVSQIIQTQELKNEPGKPPVINDTVQLSMAYFMQEVRRPGLDYEDPERMEKLKELEEEAKVHLSESLFILPFVPRKGENGEPAHVGMHLVKIQDKTYQPVFTDLWECNKFMNLQETKNETKLMILSFDKLKETLNSNAEGYVVNVQSVCMLITKNALG